MSVADVVMRVADVVEQVAQLVKILTKDGLITLAMVEVEDEVAENESDHVMVTASGTIVGHANTRGAQETWD